MLARARMLHWCAAPLGLALFACEGGAPTDPPSAPAAITIVSGNDQEGAAGGLLDEPFTVRVTDARGDGVGDVQVGWRVASGAGQLQPPTSGTGYPLWRVEGPLAFTTTGFTGVTRILFSPGVLGTSTVTAEVDGIQGSSAVFTTRATRLAIWFGRSGDCATAFSFRGPDGSSDVTVPLGTTVYWSGGGTEWLPGTCFHARIVSTREPPGGEPFDSGTLTLDASFEFTPGVAGTWEYADEISGATGTLTAH